jgi:hypothetical protein
MKNGNNIFNPLFIRRFMVKIVFRPGKKRQTKALGIIFFDYREACFNIIGRTYSSIRFLALVKNIQSGVGLENPVRINQEKRCENCVRLLNYRASRI